ncbi:TetR/AcrR family transcriptional regulator [Amycolatopsis anabasis]|uniref:TetR/AcrR family transcriptional regulator n=1 Tax=Amycolatopsis anabasis TaxID=1840409 RepID=UPI00131DC7E6|nr:TetR/AcrR family transcriptional regulator [Amycolatopsis anabasis]
MARPREFDEERAVERAMQAFWSSGYERTSTQELCAATGLGRSSIYNTFTSKHELFRKSLRHYCDTATGAWVELLDGPGTARERLHRMLARVIDDEVENQSRGCLVVNTIAELGGRDPEIGAILRADTDRLIAAIGACIRSGQRDGEIDRGKDARALAQFVHCQIGGIRMISRNGADRTTMTNVAEIALSAL